MPGHHQTLRLRLCRARTGIVTILALVVVAIGRLSSADSPGAQPSPSSEDVVLSADSVRYWDDADGVRWVVLQGQSAALQGGDGLRADAIVARIERNQRRTWKSLEVEIHTEGHARTTEPDCRPSNSRRASLSTTGELKLTAFREGGLVKLDAAPKGLAILARGFPGGPSAPPAKSKAAAAPVVSQAKSGGGAVASADVPRALPVLTPPPAEPSPEVGLGPRCPRPIRATRSPSSTPP